MEVKPIHIIGASIFAFFAIVVAGMISNTRDMDKFREKLSSMNITAIRAQRVAEEQMLPEIVAEVEAD